MNTHTLVLGPEHIAAHAAQFSLYLARILPHTSYTLYFPPQAPQMQWLARERSLLLPLVRGNAVLGGFLAQGVQARHARRCLPIAAAISTLCLDALESSLRGRTDPLTGFALPHILQQRLCDEAENIRADFDGTPPLHRLCAALILISWPDRRFFAAEHGHIFADKLTRALAKALGKAAPADALVARTAEHEFALLLPSSTRAACRKLGARIEKILTSVNLTHPVTRQRLRAQCSVHCLAYPQDIPSACLGLPMEEQGRILLDTARQAQAASAQHIHPEDTVSLPLLHGESAAALRRLMALRAVFTLALIRVPVPYTQEQWQSLCSALGSIALFACEDHALCLHEGTVNPALEQAYAVLCQDATAQGVDVTVGLAAYPVLQCHKDEILLCARKALALATLLPAPRVGVFGSLALHISADKLYSAGEVFAAIEEYRRALLLDARNALAWNSLGVCLADIAQPLEARHAFLRANALKPGDAATLYNLGSVCQNLGSARAAAHWYRRCASVAPAQEQAGGTAAVAYQTFAYIRLGHIAEKSKRRRLARQYYQRAASVPQAEHAQAAGLSMALRHLAQLDRRRNPDAARASLHEVLRHSPDDALALEMLAALYLQGQADPGMAEMLARKSVTLRPGHYQAWETLAQALRAQGKEAEAREAQARTALFL